MTGPFLLRVFSTSPHRPRRKAALYYIAEILSPFDRVAYLYDRRAVAFNGLAAEAQPPRQKHGAEYLSDLSWWRSPCLASFRSGNFDFLCLTRHVRWGDDKANEKTAEDKDILVMGDFNIPSETSPLSKAVSAKGPRIPEKLLKSTFGSNLEKNERYDQTLRLPLYKESFINAGAVLDFYTSNHKPLFKNLTRSEFTYRLCDHLPLWVQINTDTDDLKLEQLIQG